MSKTGSTPESIALHARGALEEQAHSVANGKVLIRVEPVGSLHLSDTLGTERSAMGDSSSSHAAVQTGDSLDIDEGRLSFDARACNVGKAIMNNLPMR
jgi:hypothetical protein